MSYKFTLRDLPGGMEITGESQDAKHLFEDVCFWQGLPTVCPVDGTATVLYFKEPKGNSYYSIASTGSPTYQFPIGQNKEGGGMYPKHQWTYFDGNVDIVIWENGRMTPAGVAHAGKNQKPAPTAPPPNPAQPPPTAAPPPAVGSCTECHAPASKPHATGCPNAAPTITSLDEVEALDPNPSPASAEWDAMPGVQAGVTATEHAAQLSKQAAAVQRAQPTSSGKFHAEVESTFGGMDVDAARHWYTERWTGKHTPENVRTSANDLHGDEMTIMVAELKKFRAGIRKVFGELAAAEPA